MAVMCSKTAQQQHQMNMDCPHPVERCTCLSRPMSAEGSRASWGSTREEITSCSTSALLASLCLPPVPERVAGSLFLGIDPDKPGPIRIHLLARRLPGKGSGGQKKS